MRVLVLESEPSWQDLGIAKLLDSAPGITAVLERDLGDQTWSKAGAGVVLVSERSARHDARRSLNRLRKKFPHSKILIHGEQSDPDRIAELIAQGADGYFALSLGEDKLLKAIEALAGGEVWTSREAIASIVRELHGRGAPSLLSTSDEALLKMLEEGLGNKEMAARLGVAEITVKTRLARLYRRFGVNTRVQLLGYAVRNGLLRSC